jgi:zinc protease
MMLAERGGLRFAASAPKSAATAPMREALIKTLEGLAADPIRADEVERAKQRILTQMDVELTKTHSFATGLTEWIALGDWRLFFRYRDYLHAVTAEAVNQAARTYLIPSNRTLGQFDPVDQVPQRAALPARPDLAVALKDFAGPPGIGGGEAFEPSPANIEARTTRFTLANGMKVAFLPKKSRGGMVSAALSFQYGNEQSKFGRAQACGYAGAMLMRGTRSKTRDAIRNEMTALRANLSVGGGGASVEVPVAGLEASLALIAEILTEPRFDSGEFEQLKRQSIAGIEAARTEPASVSSLALSRHLNPHPRGHWAYTATLDEQLEDARKVSLADARRCYEDFFGLSQAQLAIAGDFDPEKIRPVLATLFGGITRNAPYARIPGETRKAPPLTDEIVTPDKANATLRAVIPLDLRDDDPDYPALALANYLFGGSIDARLAKRIREKEGLSYSVGSGLSVSSLDRDSRWSASAIFAPQNRARVEAAFREELERARRDGFSDDEVAKAKDAILQSRRLGRASDMSLAGKLASDLYYGRTYAWDAALEEKIKAVTPAAAQTAFVRHIDPARLSLVKAGDFR